MKNVKILSFLLAILMVAAPLASCSNGSDKTGADTTGSGETTAAESTVAPEDLYKPDLPEKDFGGYVFRMISRDDSMHSYPVHTRDLAADEETGDIMNDAIYKRNLAVGEKYNVKFELTTFNEVTNEALPNQAVEKAVKAGDDAYDLLLTHMLLGGNTALAGVLLDWYKVPYIDFTKPYWCQGAVEGLSVGDKMFLTLSDMLLSSNDNTHVMLFNKKLAADYDIENPYELVKNNKWTMDKFAELVKGASKDLNGDTKMTDEDQYGYYIGGSSGQLNYLWAGGSQVMSKDENNRPFLDMNNERTIQIYEKLYALRTSDDTYYTGSWVDPVVPTFYSANKALFMTTQVGVIEDLRQMETDFGILPYPKLDETQEKYGHYVDGHAALMAVPLTTSDLERTGIIIEALSYEGYKSVLPVYYDTMLNTKYTRDEESSGMLDIVFGSRVFDFAYVYDNFALSFIFSTMLDAKNKNFVSAYTKSEKAEIKRIEKVLAQYDSIE